MLFNQSNQKVVGAQTNVAQVTRQTQITTDGAAYIAGHVHTEGDFVGGDNVVFYQGKSSPVTKQFVMIDFRWMDAANRVVATSNDFTCVIEPVDGESFPYSYSVKYNNDLVGSGQAPSVASAKSICFAIALNLAN